MNVDNYKYLSIGTVTAYGNSCIIKENSFGISEEDQRQIYYTDQHYRKKRKPPKRRTGDIKSFSKNSRLRLLKKVNKADFQDKRMPYFITLTYPERYPTNREEYKTDLDVIIKRLKSEFGELEYIWRLEAQKRGAPHYHFIIDLNSQVNIEYLKKWVSRNWYEVVQRFWDEKDEKHLKAGTNCKRVKNYKQLICYVSKYMTKQDADQLENPGRYWGSSRNWGIFIAEDILTGRELIQFRRLLKRYLIRSNPYMARKITRYQNIEIWAPWRFIRDAYLWAKYQA